jgi:hypothetical protein
MKLNLQRLEELKTELHGPDGPAYEHHEPMGLHIIMEAVRGYIFNGDTENNVITDLLIDYGVLVDNIENEKPIVPPHNFGG